MPVAGRTRGVLGHVVETGWYGVDLRASKAASAASALGCGAVAGAASPGRGGAGDAGPGGGVPEGTAAGEALPVMACKITARLATKCMFGTTALLEERNESEQDVFTYSFVEIVDSPVCAVQHT
jgi:hypothetical protein